VLYSCESLYRTTTVEAYRRPRKQSGETLF
jgi:hypothetical protein